MKRQLTHIPNRGSLVNDHPKTHKDRGDGIVSYHNTHHTQKINLSKTCRHHFRCGGSQVRTSGRQAGPNNRVH
jgi:hypothetical protein